MLAYQLRLAWKSLRRNPVLSSVIVVGIGLGIAVAMTFVSARVVMARDPIPHKSERLHYVQLDFWNPDRPWDDDEPELPPDQLTYRDARALLQSDIPTAQTVSYKAELTLHPLDDTARPTRELTRMCTAGFFELFEPPFAWGGPWDAAADEGPAAVVVLDHATNERLFGGENSVGRHVRIEDRDFEVVGVLAPWRPAPKYYDTHNGIFDRPEALFVPFDLGRTMELYTAGNNSNWKSYDGDTYQSMLDSESIWLQAWVQLDDEAQREAYQTFLRAYADQQEAAGRPARQENIRLSNVQQWLDYEQVVPDEVDMLVVIALLFLVICSVNLIGILLGKFLARSAEVGVRRALGASRRWVFLQHVVECQLIGVLGGLVGLGLAWVSLRVINGMFEDTYAVTMNLPLLAVGIALALLSALVAGIYPAWRICRIAPSVHLKTQ